jgi:hypothetical protein
MTIRKNVLVLLRKNALQFYSLPSVAGDPVVLVKIVEIPTVWEAAVCNPISKSSPDTSLHLIVLSPVGIERCVINFDTLTELDDQPVCLRFSVAKKPQYPSSDEPWYKLCVGETGLRILWLSESKKGFRVGPHFIYINVPPHHSDSEVPVIAWGNDVPEQPALWALPVLDVDEALGLTVIGNCFGELAIYDHAGKHPENCSGLALDFPNQPSPISSNMPTVSVVN